MFNPDSVTRQTHLYGKPRMTRLYTTLLWLIPIAITAAGLGVLQHRRTKARHRKRILASEFGREISTDENVHLRAVDLMHRLATGEDIIQGIHGRNYVIGRPPRWERANRQAVTALRERGLIAPARSKPLKAWHLSNQGHAWVDVHLKTRTPMKSGSGR